MTNRPRSQPSTRTEQVGPEDSLFALLNTFQEGAPRELLSTFPPLLGRPALIHYPTEQEGHAHMAFVSRHPELARQAIASQGAISPYLEHLSPYLPPPQAIASQGEFPSGKSGCIGVITLEDIIEEILTEERGLRVRRP